MSNEDGSPCLAHLGDSVSGFTTICPGVEGIITASFLPINGLQPSSLYPPGSLTVKRIFFAPSQVFCLLSAFSLRTGAEGSPWSPLARGQTFQKSPRPRGPEGRAETAGLCWSAWQGSCSHPHPHPHQLCRLFPASCSLGLPEGGRWRRQSAMAKEGTRPPTE